MQITLGFLMSVSLKNEKLVSKVEFRKILKYLPIYDI